MNNFNLDKTLVPARWFFSFTILFSSHFFSSSWPALFKWGTQLFKLGFVFPVRTPNWSNGVSAGKRDQIDKKFFFKITNVLDQMIKSTYILLINFFLKKIQFGPFFSTHPTYKAESYFIKCE